MSADLHRFGRAALVKAWPLETGQAATLPELQIAGAVANLESAYGTAAFTNRLTGESRRINNWGAVRSGSPPCDGVTGFEATDTSPVTGPFQQCFAIHTTAAEGAKAFVHQITTRRPESWAAMRDGDIDRFSSEMHTRHGSVGAYYEGFGATPAAQIDHHATAVERGVGEIALAMNEPILAVRGGSGPGSGGGFLETAGEMLLVATGALTAGFLFNRWRKRHA